MGGVAIDFAYALATAAETPIRGEALMSHKFVKLNDGVYAIVEPINPEHYEHSGDKTLVSVRVVELRVAKKAVRED